MHDLLELLVDLGPLRLVAAGGAPLKQIHQSGIGHTQQHIVGLGAELLQQGSGIVAGAVGRAADAQLLRAGQQGGQNGGEVAHAGQVQVDADLGQRPAPPQRWRC